IMSNSSLTGRALRVNYETQLGGGGGFGTTEGTRSIAGGVGTFACTYAKASAKAYMSFAIRPFGAGPTPTPTPTQTPTPTSTPTNTPTPSPTATATATATFTPTPTATATATATFTPTPTPTPTPTATPTPTPPPTPSATATPTPTPPMPNQAPVVNAGPDQTIHVLSAALSGSATDDGLPNPPGALTYTWSKVSGPGTVAFANQNAASTTATFSLGGVYTLQLTANDGALAGSDTIVLTVATIPIYRSSGAKTASMTSA